MFWIHTNSDVAQPAYLEDRDGNPIAIDADFAYRCAIKRRREDHDAVLVFETAGSGGLTINVVTGELDGLTRDYFLFRAPQSLVSDLTPGPYVADILLVDAGERTWQLDFDVLVTKGISAP